MTNFYNKEDLIQNFKKIGLKKGMVIFLHGLIPPNFRIIGGAQTFLDALLDVLSFNGTIVMDMECNENSDPGSWLCHPDSLDDIEKIRISHPCFHKMNSQNSFYDEILDNLRRRKGVEISNHPTKSFVSYGRYAKFICNHHELEFGYGLQSPLARIYELKALTLLFNVDYDRSTIMYFAQYRCNNIPVRLQCSNIEVNGNKKVKKYLELSLDNSDFKKIGYEMEKDNLVNKFQIDGIFIKIYKCFDAVNYCEKYFESKILPYQIWR